MEMEGQVIRDEPVYTKIVFGEIKNALMPQSTNGGLLPQQNIILSADTYYTLSNKSR